MRRAALAVLLSFLVPILLLAQRHAAEGGSGSSAGYSGSSPSSSYSGGTSVSNSASSSAGSGSSHSSSAPAGSSGSGAGYGGGSGGGYHGSDSSTGANHAGSHSSGAGGSGQPSSQGGPSRSSVGTNPQSNFRTGKAGSEHMNPVILNNGEKTSSPSAAGTSSGLTSASGEAWMENPIRLHPENGDMNKALKAGKFDAERC